MNIKTSAYNTWISVGLNPGRCGIRLESNQLNNGMDVELWGISITDININLVSQY